MSQIEQYIQKEKREHPYTDEELAKLLQVRRETVIEERKRLGIPDSRARLRKVLREEVFRLLQESDDISDRMLTVKLQEKGFHASRYLVSEIKNEYKCKQVRNRLNEVQTRTKSETVKPADASENETEFTSMIGFDGGLRAQVRQAKAAVAYPPKGLHTLIIGPSGTGKTMLAENMYQFAIHKGILPTNAPFVAFNCADYADNPQLLNSQLFGYEKGAFSGATETHEGLVKKADGGILFLDEVHRLSPEGQEMLFYLLDKGSYRRLGDVTLHKVQIRLIAATTSTPESALLLTFRRRIPIVISMPALSERPLSERFDIICHFFREEQKKIHQKMVVEKDAVRILLQYGCSGNIGQLQSDIQVACANAFLDHMSREDDAVYVREELLDNLMTAGEANKRIESENLYCRKLVFGGELDELPEVDSEVDSIYSRMNRIHKASGVPESERMDALRRQLTAHFLRIEQQQNVGYATDEKRKETYDTVKQILTDMEQSLNPLTDALVENITNMVTEAMTMVQYGLSMEQKLMFDPQEQYPVEFQAAIRFAELYLERTHCSFPERALAGLTLCFYAFSACKRRRRVRIILMTHGDVGKSIADTVSHIYDNDNLLSVTMGWEESSEQVLERIIALVQKVDEGHGCLLLVDMGSLASFAPEIALRTGVPVRCVARVDTLMALDAVYRADGKDGQNLDALADALEVGRLHAGFSGTEKYQGNPSAILTVCITGEGYAQRIKSYLRTTVAASRNVHIEDVGLLNRDAVLQKVEELRQSYDIVAAVGTINPELPGIPFLSMEYLFSGYGTMALTNLLENHRQEETRLTDIIEPQLVLCDANFANKNEVIDHMCTILVARGYVKPEFLLSVYKRENLGTTCLEERVAVPHGEPAYVNKSAICVAKLVKPMEWADGCVADFVFLFALTENSGDYVKVFYEKIRDKKVLENLRKSASSTEIFKNLI